MNFYGKVKIFNIILIEKFEVEQFWVFCQILVINEVVGLEFIVEGSWSLGDSEKNGNFFNDSNGGST